MTKMQKNSGHFYLKGGQDGYKIVSGKKGVNKLSEGGLCKYLQKRLMRLLNSPYTSVFPKVKAKHIFKLIKEKRARGGCSHEN